MKNPTTSAAVTPSALVEEVVDDVRASFERLCRTAGLATLTGMMEEDAARLCGPRHGRDGDREGHCWSRAKGKVDFHGGKVEVERPRVRARDDGEMTPPSWAAAVHGQAYANLEDARLRIGAFIAIVYNARRLHSALGYKSPAEFEADIARKSQTQTSNQGVLSAI